VRSIPKPGPAHFIANAKTKKDPLARTSRGERQRGNGGTPTTWFCEGLAPSG